MTLFNDRCWRRQHQVNGLAQGQPATSTSNMSGNNNEAVRYQNRRLPQNCDLKFATWNVRTLNDTRQSVGKVDMLIMALQPYRLDICGLSEVRWPGHGHTQAPHGWSIVYSGSTSGKRERGVGFALSPAATLALIDYTPVSERIILAQFRIAGGSILSVIQVYAPTNESCDEDKDAFMPLCQIPCIV